MEPFEIVEDLVQALSNEFTDMLVESFPDQIDENYELLHSNGAILVRWNGQSVSNRDLAMQTLVDNIEIAVLSRTLKDDNTGIYRIFSRLKSVINSIFYCGMKYQFISFDQVGYYIQQHVWHYSGRVMLISFENI